MAVADEEEQKAQLKEMVADTVVLIKDKSHALKALQSVIASYDTAISDKQEILFLHQLLMHVHETLLEWQEGMNSSIWAPSEILLAVVEHESKNDAIRKEQHLRLKSLLETKNLANSTRDDDADRSIVGNGSANPEDVTELKQKLARITAEKEEYKKRSRLEMYQMSCRECDSGKFGASMRAALQSSLTHTNRSLSYSISSLL